MILPSKHLPEHRALLGVGAVLIELLSEPKTVSRLWDEFADGRSHGGGSERTGYDWFVLALDLLFLLDAIEFDRGRVQRVQA